MQSEERAADEEIGVLSHIHLVAMQKEDLQVACAPRSMPPAFPFPPDLPNQLFATSAILYSRNS